MLSNGTVKQFISDPKISQKDKLLLCLSVDVSNPKAVKSIIQIGINCGFTAIKKLNVSSILSRQKGLVVRSPDGWELSDRGKAHLTALIGGPVAQLSSVHPELPIFSSTEPVKFWWGSICFIN